MNTTHHPIRTTLFFGLVCGVSFIPADLALKHLLPEPGATNLTLWLFVAGYSLLLSRWSKIPIPTCVYPLLLLLLTSYLVGSVAAFYLLSLAVISWIRSGICFLNHHGIKLAVELLLCVLGGIMAAVFTPGSALTWVLGIWMFFMIQSLYFVIFEMRADRPHDPNVTDPFERASRQAEAILSDV